jgi:excisionase family DNA binding protein
MTDQPRFLTVQELARLLRIKDRKVYDLAAKGDIPCTRATGKLLFPERQIIAWIEGKQTAPVLTRPATVLGSHDPLLEWAIRQSECGLATHLSGSGDGVARFVAGDGVATGLHIQNDSDGWNTEHVRAYAAQTDAVLITWATRQRGLITRPDKALTTIKALAGQRVATRQPTSGTARLLDRLLAAENVTNTVQNGPYHSEQDATLAVAEGDADVTFGLAVMAHQLGLSFAPIADERFDLLIERRAYFEPPMQALLRFCQTPAFAARAANMPGYDITDRGRVIWTA